MLVRMRGSAGTRCVRVRFGRCWCTGTAQVRRVVIHCHGPFLVNRSLDGADLLLHPAKLCGAARCARCVAIWRTLLQRAGALAAANMQLSLLDVFVPFWLKLDLTTVVLSHNRISELPNSFAGLALLEELRLSNNLLASFPAPVHARKHTRMNRCARARTEHTCIGAGPQPAPHP